MDRRQLLKTTLGGGALALAGASAVVLGEGLVRLPWRRTIKVAFMLGQGTNMIDTAGPWETFQDAQLADARFELFTVGPDVEPRRMSGGFNTAAHHSFANAPQPNVIVVPAHGGTQESLAWLREASRGTDVTLSVCTGAFHLAEAGLLDGLPATTHHAYWDEFARSYPRVQLRRGVRFVDNGHTASAGGLTSGIDLALHIVSRYFGEPSAAATAAYLEHDGPAWRAASTAERAALNSLPAAAATHFGGPRRSPRGRSRRRSHPLACSPDSRDRRGSGRPFRAGRGGGRPAAGWPADEGGFA